jgi:uncharacterized protein YggE
METNKKTTVLAIGLAVTVLVVATFIGNREITINPNAQEHTITVSAESERLVTPDTAKVSFTMTRKSPDLEQATESVNERISEMVDSMSEFGVEDADIKTTSYSVQPEYNYVRESGKQVFDGYRVRQTIELTIRDLAQVSPILTQISDFSVDNVSGLSFYVDDDQKIKDELREEAIDDAKAKARVLARDLGVQLNTIVRFTENPAGNPRYPAYGERAYSIEGDNRAVSNAVVPTGENKYTSRVSITYLIEN